METRTCVIVVLALALLGACLVICAAVGILTYAGFRAGDWAQAEEIIASEVAVEAPAALRVRNPVGDVAVRPGPDADRMVVEAGKEARSYRRRAAEVLLDEIEVQVVPEGSLVHVEVIVPDSTPTQFGSVDLVITVPERTDVELINEAGHMIIEGIEGEIRVRSETGTLRMQDVTLAGSCDVMNTTGDIVFAGQLPEPGDVGEAWEVLLRTETGDVDFAVPADSPFTLDAESETGTCFCQSKTGTVDSKFELEGLQSGRDQGEVGRWFRGGVNQEPDGRRVILSTETGNIMVGPR